MDCLEVREFIVVCVNTGTKEEARIAAVDDPRGLTELNEIGLVFLVAGSDEAVDL